MSASGVTGNEELPIEQYSALTAIEGLQHAFIRRVPGIEVAADKAEALRRLDRVHGEARSSLAIGDMPLVTAEQVHGRDVAVIDQQVQSDQQHAAVDGLITNQQGVVLGIYVADCGAVYIVDPVRRVIALVHSGKKGTELGIAAHAIELMSQRFGSRPADLIVQLSPCIRPPHYEIDFAADIVRQCQELGVSQVHDSGVCTACDLGSYYSYRAEKSRTGRMFALLALV